MFRILLPVIIFLTQLNELFFFNWICPQKMLPPFIYNRQCPAASDASLIPTCSPPTAHPPRCSTPSARGCVIDAHFQFAQHNITHIFAYYIFKTACMEAMKQGRQRWRLREKPLAQDIHKHIKTPYMAFANPLLVLEKRNKIIKTLSLCVSTMTHQRAFRLQGFNRDRYQPIGFSAL